MVFLQREKVFKCLLSFLLGYFSEDIKMWPSHSIVMRDIHNIR